MEPVKNTISSSEYTGEYYIKSCTGYSEFFEGKGLKLLPRFRIPLELANIQEGMRVVDVGCGRGEVVINAALAGAKVWGLDYSRAAVSIAKGVVNQTLEPSFINNICIHQADARYLPFPNDYFDRVFMLDVVEHLNPDELQQAFLEVKRILKPGGLLIVHTVPNLWYYWFGYPLYRWFQFLRGIKLPKNPRDRSEYSHFHINEQTPLKLRKSLRECQFKTNVWLESTVDYQFEKNSLVRIVMIILTKIYPFRWIFCDDIFAIANKQKGG